MEPKFDEYMKPILEVMKDRAVRRNPEIKTLVIAHMGYKKEDFKETQKNGNMRYLDNIGFALSYLFMAGLLDRPSRGAYQISEEGLKVINNKAITEINEKYLRDNYPEFKERVYNWHKKKDSAPEVNENPEQLSPMEKIEEAENIIKEGVKNDLLAALQELDDTDFERFCLKFLLKLDYGYDKTSGLVTKKSGDGGVDGIIFGDKLGLEKIAYQAKHWTGNVGREPVSQFVTDFNLAKCSRGIFITTSKFTSGAIDVANNTKDLVLIDGDKLADLMYEHGIGVQTKATVHIKEIDSDFFEEL